MNKEEAMKILKDFHDESAIFSVRTALETLHPELRESEDEKMMHQLYSWMKEFGGAEEYTEKVYTWLKSLIKKQETSYTKRDVDDAYLKDISDAKNELEKQDEQKSTLRERYKNIAESEWFKKTHEGMSVFDDEKVDNVNKIEPKFKVGDYIERKDGLGCHAKVIFLGKNVYGCEKLICPKNSSPFFELMFENQDEFRISSDFQQKPVEYNEENEHRIKLLEALCEDKLFESVPNSTTYEEMKITIDWLKSLKSQNHWKPSDEQMEALRNTLHPDDPYYVDLSSLYNDLKKLT